MARRRNTGHRGVQKTLNYIELEGQDELRAALKTLNIEAIREATAAIADSAREIEMGAKARVRVDEGKTRDSIDVRLKDSGLTASIGSGYFNARFEEMGTRNKAPHPFLWPAFESVRPHYLTRLEVALNTAGKNAETA